MSLDRSGNQPLRRAIRLTTRADQDLEDIFEYSIRTWSIQQAEIYFAQIMTALIALANNERPYQPVSVRSGYFKMRIGLHFVIFRITPQEIDVIRILHSRMDVDRHL